MNDKHPLGRLIEDTKKANGWSDENIAERATRAGHTSSKQNIGRIKNQPVTTVKAEQIKLLAAGLGVPEVTVARAAVASMGFPEIESSIDDLAEVVRTSPDLSARDKGIVSAVLTAMRPVESEQTDEQGNVTLGSFGKKKPPLRLTASHHDPDAVAGGPVAGQEDGLPDFNKLIREGKGAASETDEPGQLDQIEAGLPDYDAPDDEN